MSGQCLSPSETGHALTPATHLSLGEPLPHQQANRTQAPLQAESHLWSEDIIRYYQQFPAAIPVLEAGNLRVTLPFAARVPCKQGLSARLACLIHAANVHSEPGSNPSVVYASSRHLDHPNRATQPPAVTSTRNGLIPSVPLVRQHLAVIQTSQPHAELAEGSHYQIVKEPNSVHSSE